MSLGGHRSAGLRWLSPVRLSRKAAAQTGAGAGPGDVPPGYSAVLAVPLPVAFPALRAPSGSEVVSLVVLVYHLQPCFSFTRKALRISPDTRVEKLVV